MADAVVVSSPEETVVEAPVEETDFLEETKAETGRDQQPSTRLAEDSAATPTKRRRSSGSGTTGRKMEKVVVKKLEEVCRLEPKTEVEVVGHMVELSKPTHHATQPCSRTHPSCNAADDQCCHRAPKDNPCVYVPLLLGDGPQQR